MVGARSSVPHAAACQCPSIPSVIAEDPVRLGNDMPAFDIVEVGPFALRVLTCLPRASLSVGGLAYR